MYFDSFIGLYWIVHWKNKISISTNKYFRTYMIIKQIKVTFLFFLFTFYEHLNKFFLSDKQAFSFFYFSVKNIKLLLIIIITPPCRLRRTFSQSFTYVHLPKKFLRLVFVVVWGVVSWLHIFKNFKGHPYL